MVSYLQRALMAVVVSSLIPLAAAAQSGQRCDFSEVPGVVWWGTESQMTLARLAAYMAPILWFSPDEPSLLRAEGPDIRTPEPFAGQPVPDSPVLYYQMDRLLARAEATGPAFQRNATDPDNSIIHLDNVAVLFMNYLAYFEFEEGLGAHPHDIEPVEFRATVVQHTWERFAEWIPGGADCDETTYVLGITRTSGKAHGLVWFWNVVETDAFTTFPMHMLVEEGKHALATDKNGDGVFTPGYDVNVRINDAWGVRDIIRTGRLVSGGYAQWMTKIRRPEHRVFPPLPDDSPLQADFQRRIDGIPHAVYELRPFPSPEFAAGDEALHHLVENQYVENWPEEGQVNDAGQWGKALSEGAVLKSLSIAMMFTGDLGGDFDLGFSFVFPAFIVKHLEEPMTGGFIVNRMYLKDENLRDFGWQLMYTPSASRWFDNYIAAGAEYDENEPNPGEITKKWSFVAETGFKFRVNVSHTPVRFLTFFTDYWGFRVGVKNVGFPDINRLTYVLEFGAGSF
jgi:hypothetical protein